MNIIVNLRRLVGQAAPLPSSISCSSVVRGSPDPAHSPTAGLPSAVGRAGKSPRAVAGMLSLFLIATALTTACSTTPRVVEVTSHTHLQTLDAADLPYFVDDRASLIRYVPVDLSIADQREDFYVHWNPGPPSKPGPTFRPGPSSVNLVKFEYRQVAKPNTVFEKTFEPHGVTAHVFQVRGEEFRSGGAVSAWRVTLWNDDQLLAEKQSFLW